MKIDRSSQFPLANIKPDKRLETLVRIGSVPNQGDRTVTDLVPPEWIEDASFSEPEIPPVPHRIDLYA